ncbi:hypothetical protein N0V90_005221 [Kalmusia sp. IMI 367209]|nr:hypothetical protein N0V90_005221 [Kalmusia sp. IMI 367209]
MQKMLSAITLACPNCPTFAPAVFKLLKNIPHSDYFVGGIASNGLTGGKLTMLHNMLEVRANMPDWGGGELLVIEKSEAYLLLLGIMATIKLANPNADVLGEVHYELDSWSNPIAQAFLTFIATKQPVWNDSPERIRSKLEALVRQVLWNKCFLVPGAPMANWVKKSKPSKKVMEDQLDSWIRGFEPYRRWNKGWMEVANMFSEMLAIRHLERFQL